MIRRLIPFTALFSLVAAPADSEGELLLLADHGTTSYSIVVAKDAPEPVEQAANELVFFLNQMTGAEFVTRTDDEPPGRFEIVLGPTNRKSLSDVPPKLRPEAWEGFVVLPEDGKLYIMGGRIARGTLYGVYDFLEQELGVRFLAPQINHVPRKPTLRVRVGPRRYDPPFEYRAHYPPHKRRPGYSEWMTRQRINSISTGWGHVTRLGRSVHTFNTLVPPGTYFDEHPEYFALIDGERTADTLCLSNPDTLRIATEGVRKWAESAGTDPGTKYIVQVSQNDSGAYCQCPDCAAADEENGVVMTGALIRFVNGVARKIGPDFPNVYVDTLAYMTSEFPPKVTRADPNVIIWIAAIVKDSGRMLTEPQVNYSPELREMDEAQRTSEIPDRFKGLETYENVKGWTRISETVYIWDYPQSFHDYLVPFPSLWPNAANIRILAETGVKGYFPQQPPTDGSEMRYLRNYVISQQQWRPYRDYRKSAEEFCRLYYGKKAGAQIMKYIDYMHRSWRKEDRPLWWGGFKEDRFVPAADRILTKASRRAETKEQRERVAEFRLPIWRLMLTAAWGNVGRVKSITEPWSYLPEEDERAAQAPWHEATDFTGWEKVEIPTRLYTKGRGHGPGWYGATFDMPKTQGPLALHFAAVDGTWDVYVDGNEVAADMPAGLGFYQEVPYVRLDEGLSDGTHTIVVRVKDGSGIYKPLQHENPNFTTADAVTIVELSAPLSPQLRAAAEGFISASKQAGLTSVFFGGGGYIEQVLRPKCEFLLTHGK